MTPRVSIVIPTKNGAATLPALLDSLWSQESRYPVEIIAIDSGSTDRTLEILRPRVGAVLSVNPRSFNHGLTRNLAISASTGDFVILTVQDALPASPFLIESLMAPFLADDRVAGTFARQQPRANASALTKWYAARAITASDEPRLAAFSGDAAFEAMPPLDRLRAFTFDNVCACIRRSVWQAIPFRETTIAEDLEWALEVLRAGHRIAYMADAIVTHSHDRSAWAEFRRTRALHERLQVLYGLQTIPGLVDLGRAIAVSLARHLWVERASPMRYPRAVALAAAWPLGQYLGARAGERVHGPFLSRRS